MPSPRALVHRQMGDLHPVEADEAAIGRDEAGDHVEDRGLARAVGAEQPHRLAVVDGEPGLVDHGAGAVALAQAPYVEDALAALARRLAGLGTGRGPAAPEQTAEQAAGAGPPGRLRVGARAQRSRHRHRGARHVSSPAPASSGPALSAEALSVGLAGLPATAAGRSPLGRPPWHRPPAPARTSPRRARPPPDPCSPGRSPCRRRGASRGCDVLALAEHDVAGEDDALGLLIEHGVVAGGDLILLRDRHRPAHSTLRMPLPASAFASLGFSASTAAVLPTSLPGSLSRSRL